MNVIPFRAKPKISAPVAASTARPSQPIVFSTADCGSGWYHDEAIKASQQAPARKH